MHKAKLIALIVIVQISILFSQAPTFEREIIVMFKPNVVELPQGRVAAQLSEVTIATSRLKAVLERINVEVIEKAFPEFRLADTLGVARTGEIVKLANLSNIYKIRLPERQNISEAVAELAAFPEIIYAEQNSIAVPHAVYPNDDYFDDPNNPGQGGYQWNLLNTGQSGGTNDADIDAPDAWDITKGNSSTLIGIIDGGVENWHEDLNGKVSGDAGWGWDGHGFLVAGIAAAKTNNSKGIAGIDWYAQINSQRIDGAGETGTYNAIMAAVNAGSDIINNSWSSVTEEGDPFWSATVRAAFANAYKLNVTAVASMGNYGTETTYYPAGYGQGIIAVGATNRNDIRQSSSSYGNHIDVVAPGVSIISCVPYTTSLGYYDIVSGTSIAAPQIPGIAGLLLAKNPNLYNDDIEQIIRISAEDVNSGTYPGWD